MVSTESAINQINTIVIPVADQDTMIAFYVEKLGFDKRADVPFGNGYRWVEVALGDDATSIALAPPPEGRPTGGRETGIALGTGQIDELHARLKAAAVDVDDDVTRMGGPVPPMFWLRDPEGNTLMVVG
jgi:catechol 2,3-dioxygenase-like lactoylglutathione lyase family enzyme